MFNCQAIRRHRAYPPMVMLVLAAIFVVLAVVFLRSRPSLTYGTLGTVDFVEYWSAGQLFLAGENPYNYRKLYQLQRAIGSTFDMPIIMWNPPWLLVWLYPLMFFSFFDAALLWLLVNIMLILTSAALIWRSYSGRGPGRSVVIAWPALLAFPPVLISVRMGQMSSLVLLGAAGFVYAVKRRSNFAAGIFLALTTIKPHVVYLLWIAAGWWVVRERRWRVLWGLAAVLLPTLAFLTGHWPEWTNEYAKVLARPPLYWQTATLGSVLRELALHEYPDVQYLPFFAGAIGYLLVLWGRGVTICWSRDAGPLLLISVGTAPYGWSFDQSVLFLPYLEIVVWLMETPGWKRRHRAVIVASLGAIAVTMLVQNALGIRELFLFWPPLAVGALYGWARWSRPKEVQDATAVPSR